jgi:sec-independent protein translocase protein TatA
MFSGIGAPELMIILVLVLILFGAGRLPAVFEQFGKGIRAFRDAQKEEPIDVTRADEVNRKELVEHERVSEADEIREREPVGRKIG